MIFDLILLILEKLAALIVAVLPSSTFLPLPAGYYSTLTSFGDYLALAANLLPDGTLTNLVAASGFILAVRLVVVPILAGQHLTIPFIKTIKR